MKKFYVDRIEEGIVVCVDEEKNLVEFRCNEISGKLIEGSVIVKKNGKLIVDETETKLKKLALNKLQNELFDENDE